MDHNSNKPLNKDKQSLAKTPLSSCCPIDLSEEKRPKTACEWLASCSKQQLSTLEPKDESTNAHLQALNGVYGVTHEPVMHASLGLASFDENSGQLQHLSNINQKTEQKQLANLPDEIQDLSMPALSLSTACQNDASAATNSFQETTLDMSQQQPVSANSEQAINLDVSKLTNEKTTNFVENANTTMWLSNGNRAIRKAVIVSKVYHRPVGGAIVEIANLFNRLGVEAYTDQSTAVGFNLDEVPILSRRGMKDCDLIIVVGGDGSLLGASRSLVDLQVPVLGINRGHLGLLTDISPNNLEDALTRVVEGNYTTEQRMMLDVRVLRRDEEGSEELIGQSLALNETVIHSGILAHMIVCRVSINGRYMYTLRSDGIIVGTPTGSTAYSLSAGGPIIEPHLDVLCLVPMFPQSLNCSPIILPGRSHVEIEFEIKDSMPEWVNVNCDGQVTIRADTKCLVSIRQHQNQLKLIHPAGYDYYSVLRQKLGWGQSLVN